MKLKSTRVLRFAAIFAALTVSIILFAGCSTSDVWARSMIEKYYFRFDGDYSFLSDMEGMSIDEMVKMLDPYSAYYTREEFKALIADNEGSKSGIGISYSFDEGIGVIIHSVIGNSPAKKAGLKAGDIVVSASAGDASATFNELDDFSNFMSARATGEEVTLNLHSGTSVTLARAEYTASYASMYLADCAYEIEYEDGERSIVRYDDCGIPQLPEGTAYIYLSQFYGKAAEEIAALLLEFNSRNCTSLIIDLRDNGGGYVSVMADIGGLFTTPLGVEAIAMKEVYKDGSQNVEYCTDYTSYKNYQSYYSNCLLPEGTDVYLMANHNSASASEALIGVLVSYNILSYENIFLSQYSAINESGEQVTIEAKTYGKGIMQSTFQNLLTGEALKLTVAGIYWANGVTIHGSGLTATHLSDDPLAPDKCSVAPASDDIVSVGYDDELLPVIEKIAAASK